MRAKNALCETVEATLLLLMLLLLLLPSDKVLKAKTWVVKLEEEEEQVKTRQRRRSRCLEANSPSSNRSLTGLCIHRGKMLVIDDADSRVVLQDGG